MESELVEKFLDGARAIAPFAGDEDRFRALFDAFLAFDRDSFRRLLAEAEEIERCEDVCGWLCSKECVLLCLELCGPPPEELPSLAEFAAVADRISSHEELVERLASAVSDRDPAVLRALVDELEIRPFCHLLCHWACMVRCELVCRVVCGPEPADPGLGDLAEALTASGVAIARLLANKEALAEAAAAAENQDCERMRAAISLAGLGPGQCELICRWICAWRCLWVCIRLCPAPPPEAPAPGLSEAFEFAQVAARLADATATVERLVAAVEAWPPQPVPWRELLDELKLAPYCIQLCHWICELLCHEFCVCVCPPSSIAVFTEIGNLFYEYDVDSGLGGNGLTVPNPFGINANSAFEGVLELNGGIALVPGAPQIQYKFEWAPTDVNGNPTGPWTTVPGAKILQTPIGQFLTSDPLHPIMEVQVNGSNTPTTSYSIAAAVDGWITVPPNFPPWPPPTLTNPQIPASALEFIPNGKLATIDTRDAALLQAWPDTTEPNSAVAGSPAFVAPAPGSDLATTNAVISPGTVTAIPVGALAAAIPGGIGISVGGVTFQVAASGAAQAATSIPVQSQVVTGYLPTGQTVAALNVYFGLRMRIRTLGDLSNGSDGGTCTHIAINNTLYDNVKQAYVTANGEAAVLQIGVQQLVTDVCAEIDVDTIGVLFTAAHPNLGSVSITITGNGIYKVPVPLPPPPVPIDWYGSAPYSMAGLPSCAYTLILNVDLLLTDGINNYPEQTTFISFCTGGGS
jgi:hypothetical protein